jgi:hypothetical protein
VLSGGGACLRPAAWNRQLLVKYELPRLLGTKIVDRIHVCRTPRRDKTGYHGDHCQEHRGAHQSYRSHGFSPKSNALAKVAIFAAGLSGFRTEAQALKMCARVQHARADLEFSGHTIYTYSAPRFCRISIAARTLLFLLRRLDAVGTGSQIQEVV